MDEYKHIDYDCDDCFGCGVFDWWAGERVEQKEPSRHGPRRDPHDRNPSISDGHPPLSNQQRTSAFVKTTAGQARSVYALRAVPDKL